MSPILIVALVVLAIFILSKLGKSSTVDLPENITEEYVKDLMRQGKKVAAIKAYRTMTGLGLKDSKDAVEAMEL